MNKTVGMKQAAAFSGMLAVVGMAFAAPSLLGGNEQAAQSRYVEASNQASNAASLGNAQIGTDFDWHAAQRNQQFQQNQKRG
ncbi:hypothetical protein [Nocardia terpenica]|nr:hypothetical protein [Nocardia terpenica]NQE87518.1 hypothetical protein [Nocardia terpenica]